MALLSKIDWLKVSCVGKLKFWDTFFCNLLPDGGGVILVLLKGGGVHLLDGGGVHLPGGGVEAGGSVEVGDGMY